MPVKNEFFGVFKTAKIGGKYILAETINRNREMEVQAKNYIQGTAKNRIMDIGGITETISVTAPILIGGGSLIDGRTLLNTQIDNALKRKGATLPLLQNATISVSGEQGGQVELSLMSDGNPLNTASVFEILDQDSSLLTDGTHLDVLNPKATGYTPMPTRLAKFYDFRVAFGSFYLYVRECRVQVEVETTKNFFLAGKIGAGTSPNGNGNPVPLATDPTDVTNWGTQFPWIGVAGIKISGSGKAAAVLIDSNPYGPYADDPGNVTDPGETVNVHLSANSIYDSELTMQLPGQTIVETNGFAIEVYSAYDGTGSPTAQWLSLFNKSGTTTPLFDLSKALIDKADFAVTTGLLTVDFGFKCYVI